MTKNNFRRVFGTFLIAVALTFSLPSRAQEPAPAPAPVAQTVNRAELHQALLDLTNSWTVMCVAAHPDDEDGTTLTVLRRRDGVHTVSLFSTFGEGGQNAVGPELYEELGVIRVHETMNAAKIQGSEPYFLGLKDFGFSKSADEAFKVWGHDEALRRMVLKIRELRPDVIITNHDTNSGHGHHQATGRLIIEAFDAAADPKRFPEQLGQLKPWRAQRLFVRVGGGSAAGTDNIFAIDPNQIDPIRGTSFAEQALSALQQHATQGPWPKSITELLRARRIEGGKLPPIRYRLVREAAGVPLLPANATTPLAGLKTPEVIVANLTPPKIEDKPLTDFLDRPDLVLAALVEWRVRSGNRVVIEVSGSPSARDLEIAHEAETRVIMLAGRGNRALAVASGVSLTLNSSAPVFVPGVRTTFSIDLANTGTESVHVDDLHFNGWGQKMPVNTADLLLPDTETVVTVDRITPKIAALTVPNEEHLYDGLFLGQRFGATALLEIHGAKFWIEAQLARDVAPAVEIKNISPSPCVRTEESLGRCAAVHMTLANNLAVPFRGKVQAEVSYRSTPGYRVLHELVLGPNEMRTDTVNANSDLPSREDLPSLRRSGSITISIHNQDSFAPITQRAVPVVYSAARVVPNLRVGYVASFDETLKHSLAAFGVDASELNVADIPKAELSEYHTIIIDNRGYEAHPELIAANSKLLEFVNAGGTLVVFYHKSNEWNPDANKNRPQLAPYPILLGDERVTDETAPIDFLLPRHPLLSVPNKITPADFANWIQERGLYYPKEWDAHYVALFSTNDPGELPLKGGLLVSEYGKGNYIYTSMVWYRELRAGVPGAYRMFANMISYGHRKS